MKKHNLNPLVAAFGSQKQWVTYRKVSIKGRTTKVPYTVTNKKASSTDPLSWSTYAEAKKASDLIGIVFSEEKTILGIDIDHCLTDGVITHPDAETIAALCIEADTYTEISPSGEGLLLVNRSHLPPIKKHRLKHTPRVASLPLPKTHTKKLSQSEQLHPILHLISCPLLDTLGQKYQVTKNMVELIPPIHPKLYQFSPTKNLQVECSDPKEGRNLKLYIITT
jgi:hypothetical protein